MRRTDLALRALKRLDVVDDGLQAADLARDLSSTRQFIPQVLAPLVRAGWVISVPGPRGGYRLVADLNKCSLLDVIEIMEGPTDDGTCVLGGPCRTGARCAAHEAWSEARGAVLERLAATPVAKVHDDGDHNNGNGSGRKRK
jgi:Rrf2 family protein